MSSPGHTKYRSWTLTQAYAQLQTLEIIFIIYGAIKFSDSIRFDSYQLVRAARLWHVFAVRVVVSRHDSRRHLLHTWLTMSCQSESSHKIVLKNGTW